MKLVIQIAGGIVLAGFMFWASSMVIAYYGAKQIENAAKAQQRIQQHLLQQQQERQAQQKAAKAEADRKRLLALQEQARRSAAFSKWYQPPEWCNPPADMQALVKCTDMKSAKRAEFYKLWAQGQIE